MTTINSLPPELLWLIIKNACDIPAIQSYNSMELDSLCEFNKDIIDIGEPYETILNKYKSNIPLDYYKYDYNPDLFIKKIAGRGIECPQVYLQQLRSVSHLWKQTIHINSVRKINSFARIVIDNVKFDWRMHTLFICDNRCDKSISTKTNSEKKLFSCYCGNGSHYTQYD